MAMLGQHIIFGLLKYKLDFSLNVEIVDFLLSFHQVKDRSIVRIK